MKFKLTNYVDFFEEEEVNYIIHRSNGKVLKITHKMKKLLCFLKEYKSESEIKNFLIKSGTTNGEVNKVFKEIISTLTKFSIIKEYESINEM